MMTFFRRTASMLALVLAVVPAIPAGAETPESQAPRSRLHERIVREGVAIQVDMEPVAGEEGARLQEGEPVHIRFTITDANSGQPFSSLYPAAWMDLLPSSGNPIEGPRSCQEKVEAYVGGSLMALPEVDLNVYYVLTLNDEASISVVDPLFGFGGSKLLEMVFLKSPGEDWEMTEDQSRLFVSMPASDQVALVDTADWKVVADVDVGARPARLRLQPDERYLWATWEAREDELSGVSVVDTRELREIARITTGRGSHDMVFSDDDRYAFVSNQVDGTVSVIDVRKLEKLRDVTTGKGPVSLAFSVTGQAAYVTHRETGVVAVVDGKTHEVVSRIQAEPGIEQIRFTPEGRLGFVVNPAKNTVYILDAATQRIVQTADVEKEPYDVAFSDELAYVVHRGSEIVLMIPLKQLGAEGQPVPVVDFPGGQHPPGRTKFPTLAETIVQAPGATAVLVANPTDEAIYYYKEGMAAPMGHFKNYGRQPRAVAVVDRSLQERSPGVYETAAKLRTAGEYDLAFFLDSPRVIHCFGFKVEENPALAAGRQKRTVTVELHVDDLKVTVGRKVSVDVQVTDMATGKGKNGLRDVNVLTFLSPGIWQQRQIAEHRGEGLYHIEFTPPRPGVYYVFVEIASEKLPFNESPSVIMQAVSPEEAEGGTPEATAAPGQGKNGNAPGKR